MTRVIECSLSLCRTVNFELRFGLAIVYERKQVRVEDRKMNELLPYGSSREQILPSNKFDGIPPQRIMSFFLLHWMECVFLIILKIFFFFWFSFMRIWQFGIRAKSVYVHTLAHPLAVIGYKHINVLNENEPAIIAKGSIYTIFIY